MWSVSPERILKTDFDVTSHWPNQGISCTFHLYLDLVTHLWGNTTHFFNFSMTFFWIFKIFDVLEREEADCQIEFYIYLWNMPLSTRSVAVLFFSSQIFSQECIRNMLSDFYWGAGSRIDLQVGDSIWGGAQGSLNIITHLMKIVRKLAPFVQSWFPGI